MEVNEVSIFQLLKHSTDRFLTGLDIDIGLGWRAGFFSASDYFHEI